MMNRFPARRVIILLTTLAGLTGCSLMSSESDGSDLAAQSCSTNLLPLSSSSQIVPIGIGNVAFTADENSQNQLQQRVEISQSRSILSAKAAATNQYWQPLADAFALEEAFVRSALRSYESERISDESGSQRIDTRIYDEFITNVNLDFAAATKDTYCRIAFVKQDLEIKYEG